MSKLNDQHFFIWIKYINCYLKESEGYVMFCAIRHHLYNLKNVKNTHGSVLFLVKLQG